MNKKGSTLIWVTAVFLILSVIIISLSTISLSYHWHSVELIAENQAYFTARSAAELIADEMIQQTSLGQDMLSHLETTEGGSFAIPDFGFKESMGSCSLNAKRVNPKLIKLSANATVGQKQKTVSVYLSRQGSQDLNIIFPDLTVADYKKNSGEEYIWVDWPSPPKSQLQPLESTLKGSVATVGSEQSEAYYYVAKKSSFDGNSSKKNIIVPKGPHNVYIFVEKGAAMNVKSIGLTDSPSNPTGTPTVYIILEDGAGLDLGERNTSTKSYAYIYSKYPGNTVRIGKSTAHNQNNFFGSVISADLVLENVNGVYVPPNNSINGAPPGGKWRIVKYEDK